IVTSSGELIYSFGANSGDFSPGVCPPQEVYITWEIVASNTVDGSTVPTVPTTSTTAVLATRTWTGTSASSTGESMTFYAGNHWNTEINTQVPTFLYIPNIFTSYL
ncbi:MAG: hypothetical protein IIT65_06885, partial [Lachnospiraceae bacterium]|nr:hypothetical protein [Lachnospiraceae bacterium]